MPKSKRSKVVSLTKTDKKVKDDKKKLVNELRENLDKYEHCWVFSVGDMRNEALKEVRKQWKRWVLAVIKTNQQHRTLVLRAEQGHGYRSRPDTRARVQGGTEPDCQGK